MDSEGGRLIKAAIAGVMVVGTGLCYAAEPTVEELKAQLSELSKKVSALEAKQIDSRDASAAIESVLRDADRRSQLLQTSGEVAAGYDGGFFVRAGAFLFRPGAQFQF